MQTPQTPERPARVVIYMTEDDAETLNRLARDLKFRSRSTFVVAMLERLIIGGFSTVSFIKLGGQIRRRADEHAKGQMEFNFDALKSALRPLPALPLEDDPTAKQTREILSEIREELKHEKAICSL